MTERCLSSTEGAGWDHPPPEGAFTEAVVLLLCSSKGQERLQGSSDLVGDVLSRTCKPVMVRSLPAAAVAQTVMNEWVEEELGSFLLMNLRAFSPRVGCNWF